MCVCDCGFNGCIDSTRFLSNVATCLRVPSAEKKVDRDDLEFYLDEILTEEFHVEPEDGSIPQVRLAISVVQLSPPAAPSRAWSMFRADAFAACFRLCDL